MSGFRKFLLRGNVVELAVAVVIGAAFGAVITALVKDIITPIIGAFGGLPDFSAWAFTINGSKFMIGDFLNALLSFVVIAAVIYFLVVLPVERIMERFKPAPPPPETTRECPFCLSKIPKAATRCAFCTSEVKLVKLFPR
jgi:large conductance mechanosensitive channel